MLLFLASWSGAGVRIRRYYGHRQTGETTGLDSFYYRTDGLVLLSRMLFQFGLLWVLWTDLIKTAFQIDIHEIVGENKKHRLVSASAYREASHPARMLESTLENATPTSFFFFLYPTISSRLFRIFHYYGGVVFSGLERKSASSSDRIAQPGG